MGPESDVDLLVLTSGGRKQDFGPVHQLLWDIATEEGGDPAFFSPRVASLDWLAGRREIRSFFIQEVDRDKVVLYESS